MPRMPVARIPLVWRLVMLGLLAAVCLGMPRWLLGRRYASSIFTPRDSPTRPVAIVFGAGLFRGRPSRVLADRVRTAVQLYEQGTVAKLLMSGSTRPSGYDEPAAMRDLAVSLGVPREDILMDPAGTRTFESCVHASADFGVSRALLISQRYHLPRALATCEALGIDALGVSADLRPYRLTAYRLWQLREVPATLLALWETRIRPFNPLPADGTRAQNSPVEF